MPLRRMHGIRGATTVERDTPDEILAATRELLGRLADANRLRPEQVVSVLFSATPDLTSAFPAGAARELGWTDVPLMCMTEIPVPDALPRCIRVLVHVECARRREPVVHAYLRGAETLRPDLRGR